MRVLVSETAIPKLRRRVNCRSELAAMETVGDAHSMTATLRGGVALWACVALVLALVLVGIYYLVEAWRWLRSADLAAGSFLFCMAALFILTCV